MDHYLLEYKIKFTNVIILKIMLKIFSSSKLWTTWKTS